MRPKEFIITRKLTTTWSQAWRVLGLREASVVSRFVFSFEHPACCDGDWTDNSVDVGDGLDFRNDRR